MTRIPRAPSPPAAFAAAPSSAAWTRIGLTAALGLLAAALYAPTLNFGFLSLDDALYITDNPRVREGLTWAGVPWSFQIHSGVGSYWHPIAWLSHMLDAELFGLWPGGHHGTNVLLHVLNVQLLFRLLWRLSGAVWPSAAAAALFAVHPLHVESVAWVAERKNLLSAAFWLLAVHLYLAHAARPSKAKYTALLAVFSLGLMTKPMMVTLPFVFLLLDFWPLGRFRDAPAPGGAPPGAPGVSPPAVRPLRRLGDLALEKTPLLALSAAVCLLVLGSVASSAAADEAIPMALRLQNAVVSYVVYGVKWLLPKDLAMFYPYPTRIAPGTWAAALLALLSVTGLCGRSIRTAPYLIVGWFWFLGTLVPVSGVVQAGVWPAWADRWAYVPSMGLLIMLVGGVRDLGRRWPGLDRRLLGALAAIGLGALAWAAARQVFVWRDDATLYRHAAEVVPGNYFAYSNWGETMFREGRMPEAAALFAQALEHAPRFVPAHVGMGNALLHLGQPERARTHYLEALRESPFEKRAHNNLGVLHLQAGRIAEAIASLHAALQIDPHFAEAHNNLGYAYLRIGRPEAAAGHLEKALALDPGNEMAQANLREARERGGRP